MLSALIGGVPVWLVNNPPNWADPVDCEFRILSDYERGLTGKEDRTATSKTLRASMKYKTLLLRADAVTFRHALKNLGNTPVLCPFWPAMDGYAESNKAGISAGLWVAFEPDWSSWEFYAEGETPTIYTPSAAALKAPVLWGRFDSAPAPSCMTDEVCTVDLEFTDNSPVEYALTVAAQTFADGPDVNATARPMFPLLPNWAEEIEAGEVFADIVKDELGYLRTTADIYYDQAGARKTKQVFAAHNWTKVKQALRFFLDQGGSVGAFWLPLAASDCRLVSAGSGGLPEKITVLDCGDAAFDGEYILNVNLWEKAGGYSVFKDGIWKMTDGTILFTAPDNGLNTPPATFTRTLEYPLTITIPSGDYTQISSYSGQSDGKPRWGEYPHSIWWNNDFGAWRITNGFNVTNNYEDTPYPPKTGWESPTTLEYSIEVTATVSFTAPASNQITVDTVEGMEDASHLALIKSGTASGFEIDDLTDETFTFVESLDRDYTPSSTTISALLLARYDMDALSMSFLTDELAIVEADFIEVPEEYTVDGVNPSGENGTRAYLYWFAADGQPERFFTSFENDLVYNTDTYLARHFSHAGITDDINLEKNEVELRSRRFWNVADELDQNPLSLFLPIRLESPLSVEILEVTIDSDGDVVSPSVVYKGEVSSASFDGPMITAKCTGLAALFDRVVPTMLIQPTCNYALFGEPCGLLADDWKMTANVAQYPFSSDPYKILITPPSFVEADPTNDRPDETPIFAHYFAAGRFEKGTGTTFEQRGVLDSADNSGNIVLTLRNPLDAPPAVGSAVFIWPGCDGRKETCREYDILINPEGKFGNYPRFGGFPFVPIGNPSVAKINKDYSQGGKK